MKVESLYHKRNSKKRWTIILITVGILILFGITAVFIRDQRKLTMVENVLRDGVLTVQKFINVPIRWVQDTFQSSQESKDLKKKYQALKTKEDQFTGQEAQIAELKKELEELKKALELKQTLSEYDTVQTTVITRNIGYWYDTITVDRGEKDGITVDMPVVTKDGLVGKVVQTSYLTSTIKLLTNENSTNKVSVKIKIKDKYVYALLSGYDRETKTFIVDGISGNDEIKVGDVVTTTGMGDLFPSGIIVGKVKAISKDHFDLAKTVQVETNVNFDNLTYLTILKRKAKK